MASENVQTALAAHDAFNRRDYEALTRALAPDVLYTDQAAGIGFKGPDAWLEDFVGGWVTGLPDARTTEHQVTDGGDTVVIRFVGRGTHSGPLGPLPATGRRLSLAFCEILRFDAAGRVAEGEIYYDRLSLMEQLGRPAH